MPEFHKGSDPWTFFGLYSATTIADVSRLLKTLGVNFVVVELRDSEENLLEWSAWDADSDDPSSARALWIDDADVEKVGDAIVRLLEKEEKQ